MEVYRWGTGHKHHWKKRERAVLLLPTVTVFILFGFLLHKLLMTLSFHCFVESRAQALYRAVKSSRMELHPSPNFSNNLRAIQKVRKGGVDL